MNSFIVAVIAVLGYLVYVFKGKADKSAQSAIEGKTKGKDQILIQDEQEIQKQKVNVDVEISEIEARIKARDEK